MFVETEKRPQGEPQKAGTLKLSDAIRQGCPYVEEDIVFTGCALAAGYFTLTGRNLQKDRAEGGYKLDCTNIVSEAFGVPLVVVQEASRLHFTRKKTREQCADWLEGQGY